MRVSNAEVLNGKRVREIVALLKEQWGYTHLLEYGFLQKENDIFLITRSVDQIDLRLLNVNSLGLYFGELRHEKLRLSIEGSQIVGKHATKNVVDISGPEIERWMRGENIPVEKTENVEENGYALVRQANDFFGCGRLKEGVLLNFVSKSRRMVSALPTAESDAVDDSMIENP